MWYVVKKYISKSKQSQMTGLKLIDKNLKITMVNMVYTQDKLDIVNEGIGNLKRGMKTLKRKQMEILEKNTVKKIIWED